MKKIISTTVAVATICSLAGCATDGLSPREQSGATYSNYIMGLQSSNLAATPQKLNAPIRLAIAQVGEVAPPSAMLDKLAGQKMLVASVTGLPLPGNPEKYPGCNYYQNNQKNHADENKAEQIKSLCRLAQSAGADYIFLFGGNVDSWCKNNAFSVLDFTLIGAVIVPGSKIQVEGKGAGVLIAAATGQPILFVNTDARDSSISPDLLADGKTTALQAGLRDELIGKLTDELLKKLAEHN